jgi:hypothetical protein
MPETETLTEMGDWLWKRFKNALEDVTPDEVDWRPLPQANSISLIVRHLRIEAAWHLACLEEGAAMPAETTPALQEEIDSVPLDFAGNLAELDRLYTRFLAALGRMELAALERRTGVAYQGWPRQEGRPPQFLGFHQTMHMAMHFGQITSLRNMYRRARGEPGRFFPDNPSFPKTTPADPIE